MEEEKGLNIDNDEEKSTNSNIDSIDKISINNDNDSTDNEGNIKSSKESIDKTNEKSCVFVKIGLIGDASVGKTTLMVKYVENKFDEVYIETLGVSFMEKTITLRNTDITFSLWDLGGRQEFLSKSIIIITTIIYYHYYSQNYRYVTISL